MASESLIQDRVVDLDNLKCALGEQVYAAAVNILEGSADDLADFAEQITKDMAMVLLLPDEKKRQALLRELKAQWRVLAEINRVRVEGNSWVVFGQVLDIILKTVVGTIISVCL